MAAVELVKDPETKEPAGDFANTLRANLYKNGVINIGAGTFHNVVRVLVPLTIEDDVLARGLDIFEQTLAQTAAYGLTAGAQPLTDLGRSASTGTMPSSGR